MILIILLYILARKGLLICVESYVESLNTIKQFHITSLAIYSLDRQTSAVSNYIRDKR